MIIRQAIEEDAEKFAVLIKEVENNSKYMLFGPGERSFNPSGQRKMIQAIKNESNSTIFLAEDEGDLIGYLIAKGGNAKRNKHSAYLVIGIKEGNRGRGVGTNLFEELCKWAEAAELHRLELTVVADNHAGLGLYKKMGFEIEGTKKNSLLINGHYMNEFYMSKIIEGSLR